MYFSMAPGHMQNGYDKKGVGAAVLYYGAGREKRIIIAR
jgi:hypothetical protein